MTDKKTIPNCADCSDEDDMVNHPSHYKSESGIECIQDIEGATEHKTGLDAYCTGNIIKYLWRCEDKNGLEDIRKAEWHIKKMIAHNATKK